MKRCAIFDEKGRLIYTAFRTDPDIDFTQKELDEVIEILKIDVQVSPVKVFIAFTKEELAEFSDMRNQGFQPMWDGAVFQGETKSDWLINYKQDYVDANTIPGGP